MGEIVASFTCIDLFPFEASKRRKFNNNKILLETFDKPYRPLRVHSVCVCVCVCGGGGGVGLYVCLSWRMDSTPI